MATKEKKRAMTCILHRGITIRPTQHRAGRVNAVAENFECDVIQHNNISKIHDYDELFLYTLPEDLQKGNDMSVYGGIAQNRELFDSLIKNMSEFKGDIYQLDGEFDYREAYRRRHLVLPEKFSGFPVRTMKEFVGRPAVIGDSHCASIRPTGWRLFNDDGKTLYSALSDDVSTLIPDDETTQVAFYFGNIDIRHHICRQDDPLGETRRMAELLIEQAMKIDASKEVWLTHLLPMTSDDRKVPKSGMYKKTPFFGSWSDRQDCINLFNQILDEEWLATIRWDDRYWKDGHLNPQSMESKQSVHLAPHSYNTGWATDES